MDFSDSVVACYIKVDLCYQLNELFINDVSDSDF